MKKCFLLLVCGFIGIGFLSAQTLVRVQPAAFDRAVLVDGGFRHFIEAMGRLASKNNLQIRVQGEGFRRADTPVMNQVVPPSAVSNHLVGHAVDINIVYNRTWFNASALRDFNSLPQSIQNFIIDLEAIGMRWGGRFSPPDPVHFDIGLNVHNRSLIEHNTFLNNQLTSVTIGANVNVQLAYLYAGWPQFISTYNNNGRRAGTYVLNSQSNSGSCSK